MKKVFSILLVLLMIVALMPVQALASSDLWDIRNYMGDYQFVTVSHSSASAGEKVTVRPLEGYRMTGLAVMYGEAEQVSAYPDGDGYSFIMPDGPVELMPSVESLSGGGAPHSIWLLSAGGGNPSVDKNPACAGETVTVYPNPNENCTLHRIQIDYYRTDGYNEIYYLPDGVASFVMPDDIEAGGTVKVTVYYNEISTGGPRKVTIYTDGNGTASSVETAMPGDTITVTVNPADGNIVTYFYAMGERTATTMVHTRISKNQYTLTMLDEPAYILIMFGEGTDDFEGGDDEGGTGTVTSYSVTATSSNDLHGSVTASAATAKAGETITITAAPAEGYQVGTITVTPADSTKTVTVSGSSFTMPECDVTVLVTFEAIPEDAITVTFDPNGGTVDPTSADIAKGGKLQALPQPERQGYLFAGWYSADGAKVTADTVFEDSATVTARWAKAEHTTDPDSNSFGANIDLNDPDVLALLVDEEDLASGEDISVYLSVSRMGSAPANEKAAIEAKAGSDLLATYLDVTLWKKIGSREPSRVSNTRGSVPITMILDAGLIPEEAVSVYIVYYHNGVVKTLPATYYAASRTLSFSASEFSTYALAYKVSTTNNDEVLDNVPKTGVGSALRNWTLLIACSAAMLAGVAIYDRKRAR